MLPGAVAGGGPEPWNSGTLAGATKELDTSPCLILMDLRLAAASSVSTQLPGAGSARLAPLAPGPSESELGVPQGGSSWTPSLLRPGRGSDRLKSREGRRHAVRRP